VKGGLEGESNYKEQFSRIYEGAWVVLKVMIEVAFSWKR